MKKSIFTLFFLAVIGYVSAQSMQFEWNGTVYSEGQTIECTNDEYGYGEFIQHMQIRNKTSESMKILIEKEVIQDLESVMNFFCWGMCYSADVIVSPNAVEVQANSLNTDDLSFHALYSDPDVFGDVIVKYYAYEERNPDQRISIIVRFRKSGEGVGENSVYNMGHAYPNPASSVVRFNYELSTTNNVSVSIYNLLGQEVKSQHLNGFQGQVSFSVADLNEGIYFCNLIVNGHAVKTEKFVVKK